MFHTMRHPLAHFFLCSRHVLLALIAALALPLAAHAANITLNPGDDLQAAINAATDPANTITLTGDVTSTGATIEINGKNIIFALGGHALSISNGTADADALQVYGGSVVTTTGAGSFTVASTGGNALFIWDDGSSIALTGVTVNAGGCLAIYSEDKSFVTVNGDVKALGDGDWAIGATSGSTVTVKGNVSAANGFGIYAAGTGTSVNVNNGDVSVGGGSYNDAIYGDAGASVTVNGSVSAAGEGNWGMEAYGGSTILVTGGITTTDGVAVYAKGAATTVTVNGKVAAQLTTTTGADIGGVAADGGATVLLKDDVTVTTTGAAIGVYAGAWAASGGTVTVDGTLTAAAPWISVNGTVKTAADITSPTTLADYTTYNKGDATVWVKNAATAYSAAFAAPGGGSAAAHGVTATGAITPAGAQAAGTTMTVTVTLTGTAADAGTYKVNVTSATTGVTLAAPLSVAKAVTAGQAMGAGDTYVFTFAMPAGDVTDLKVLLTFTPLAVNNATAVPTLSEWALALLAALLALFSLPRWGMYGLTQKEQEKI